MYRIKKLKITYNSPVTLGFVAICLIATILGAITGGYSTQLLFMTYHSSLLNPLTWVHFITHVFGHADLEHFMGNAMYLLLLGPMLEEKYGPQMMLKVIGATAIVTGAVHYLFFWNTALCGASGVVFAFILLSSFTSFHKGELPVTVILVAIIFIGQQVVDAVMIRDNISNMAHIVGGMVGAVIGYELNQRA